MNTYHILNGDCLAAQLRETAIIENRVVCRECLIEGPVYAENVRDFWEMRAAFLGGRYHVRKEEYYEKTVGEFEKINSIPDDATVCLWFGDDLFCQANMWFLLSVLAGNPTLQVFRIFPVIKPGSDTWQEFGMADAQMLQLAYSLRVKFDARDKELGKNLWNAFRQNDLASLKKTGKIHSDCFRYLDEVCAAHIERFPPDGLPGRPQKAMMQILRETGDDFQAAFSKFSKREGIYGFSDLQVREIYDKIIAGIDYRCSRFSIE